MKWSKVQEKFERILIYLREGWTCPAGYGVFDMGEEAFHGNDFTPADYGPIHSSIYIGYENPDTPKENSIYFYAGCADGWFAAGSEYEDKDVVITGDMWLDFAFVNPKVLSEEFIKWILNNDVEFTDSGGSSRIIVQLNDYVPERRLVDLTGAKITLKIGEDYDYAYRGWGHYKIDTRIVGEEKTYSNLAVGYYYEDSNELSPSSNNTVFYNDLTTDYKNTSIYDEGGHTFEVLGGEDSTNDDLIQLYLDIATIEGGVWEETGENSDSSATVTVDYNGQTIATLDKNGQFVILKCKDLTFEDDLKISLKVVSTKEPSSVPTDLTGYKVTIPGGFSAESGFGQFDIKGSPYFNEVSDNGYYSGGLITFHVGYYCEGGGIGCDITETTDSVFVQGDEGFGNWGISVNKEENIPIFLFITGGEDVTNSQLIQWLVDNGATFEKVGV